MTDKGFTVDHVERDFDYAKRLIEAACLEILTAKGDALDRIGERLGTPRFNVTVTLRREG